MLTLVKPDSSATFFFKESRWTTFCSFIEPCINILNKLHDLPAPLEQGGFREFYIDAPFNSDKVGTELAEILRKNFCLNDELDHELFLFIEGQIGAGKSTIISEFDQIYSQIEKQIDTNYSHNRNPQQIEVKFCKGLNIENAPQASHNYIPIPEPVDSWTKNIRVVFGEKNVSCLEFFYLELAKARTNFVFKFQIIAMFTRLAYLFIIVDEYLQHKKTSALPVIFLCERSILTDRYFSFSFFDYFFFNIRFSFFFFTRSVFFKMNLQHATLKEIAAYDKCFETGGFLLLNLCFKKKFVLFLKESVPVCLDRIKLRDRAGESLVTTEYLERLEKQMEQFKQDLKEIYFINYNVIEIKTF